MQCVAMLHARFEMDGLAGARDTVKSARARNLRGSVTLINFEVLPPTFTIITAYLALWTHRMALLKCSG